MKGIMINGIKGFSDNTRSGEIVFAGRYPDSDEMSTLKGRWYYYKRLPGGKWDSQEDFNKKYEEKAIDIYGNRLEKTYELWEKVQYKSDFYYEPTDEDIVKRC